MPLLKLAFLSTVLPKCAQTPYATTAGITSSFPFCATPRRKVCKKLLGLLFFHDALAVGQVCD